MNITANKALVWTFLSFLSLWVIYLGIRFGQYFDVSFMDILNTYRVEIFNAEGDPQKYFLRVAILETRTPRTLAAFCIGAALAVAGATYQGLFRNPLVSPDILGVSAGAGLGAALGIYVAATNFGSDVANFPKDNFLSFQILSFVGGLAAVSIVCAIVALIRSPESRLNFILIGIAIGSMFAAGTALIKLILQAEDMRWLVYFLVGGLYKITSADFYPTIPIFLLGIVPIFLFRWHLNAIAMGEEEARTLGLNTRLLVGIFIASSTLMTAAAVGLAGIMGWVGLLVPHFARLIVGPEFSRLIPASFLLGGTFLVLADLIGRMLFANEYPVGVMTALIGAPLFIWLLALRREREW